MNRLVLTLILLGLGGGAMADVQFKIKDGAGRSSTFSSNGSKVRIDDGNMPGYGLIDVVSGEFYMVDTQRNQIMRTSMKAGPAADVAPLSVELKDKGGGQKIAGYLTRKYEFRANGERCGIIYASSKLLQEKGVQAVFESMRGMQRQARGFVDGLGDMVSLCQRASMQLGDALGAKGVPMRILGEKGELVSEVTGVDTDKKFDAAYYQPPAGMEVVDLGDQMNQAAEQTQQMMQNMPDMDELMQQIQGGGGEMSEEMQQQMQKMQEMLQQLQSQQQ